MNTRKTLSASVRHIGQIAPVSMAKVPQAAQQHMWPHGTKTCVFDLDKHTTHFPNDVDFFFLSFAGVVVSLLIVIPSVDGDDNK